MAIVGLVPPDTGRVLYDDENITDVPMYRGRASLASATSSRAVVFPELTVEENILACWKLNPSPGTSAGRRWRTLIEQVGTGPYRQNRGYALSGGGAPARGNCAVPLHQSTFILLDEPFSGIGSDRLCSTCSRIIFDLKASGIGVLITDHNVRETLSVTDRAYILTKDASSGRVRGGLGQRPGSPPSVPGRELLARLTLSPRPPRSQKESRRRSETSKWTDGFLVAAWFAQIGQSPEGP